MFDDRNLIPFILLAVAITFGMFAATWASRKHFPKNRTHIIRGWRKKTRKIMRVHNEEIQQAYWKVEFWQMLCILSAFMPLAILGYQLLLQELYWPVIINLAIVFFPPAVISAIMRHIRWRVFDKLATSLGFIFEQDEEKIKEESKKLLSGVYTMKIFGIPYIFIFIFVTISLAAISIAFFATGDSRSGIINAVIAAVNIPNVILGLKAYRK